MHTVEALDSLILFRQKPDSLLRRLMATEEAVRVAAQGGKRSITTRISKVE